MLLYVTGNFDRIPCYIKSNLAGFYLTVFSFLNKLDIIIRLTPDWRLNV